MILRRLGNKKALASKIYRFFPRFNVWVEPFFGAGGMFFNIPKPKHALVNDIDNEVYNLFLIARDRNEELREAFKAMPIHVSLWERWKHEKPSDEIERALRFILFSNYGYMGKPDSLHMKADNAGREFLRNLEKMMERLFDVRFNCTDAAKFIRSVACSGREDQYFIYCDPPYLGTGNNYSESYTEEQAVELVETLVEKGVRFAISEFDSEFWADIASQHSLNIHKIGERQNMKNRRTEILITSYQLEGRLF